MEGNLFSPLNFTVLGLYLGAMLGIGAFLARRQQTTSDFFLAGRKMPWLVIAMSMYASLTSAVTFLGLPTVAYYQNVSLVVVCIMSPLVAPFLIKLFYPIYQTMRVTTSYEYLEARFGRSARFTASGLFILARLGWLGTVVYAPAMALSVVTGVPITWTILMMGGVATLYTMLGGVTADIWSDTVQFVIMIAGAAWVAITLTRAVPGGFGGILDTARAAGRLDIFEWPWTLDRMSGLTVAACFFFQLMYDYGTDQTTVQRLMATPSLKGISRAIIFNAIVDFCIIAILLFIGIGLFAFYGGGGGTLPAGIDGDRILPYYIIQALPNGVSGLLITAVFAAMMSSMDSGVSSLSTVVVHDFVKPLRRRERSESDDLRLARLLVLLFGALATGVAFYVSRFESLVEAYTSMISLFNGPILALFLLGILTRRNLFPAWLVGTGVSIGASIWFQRVMQPNWTYFFPFSFAVAIVVTVAVGLVFCRHPGGQRPVRPTRRAR